MSVCAYNSLYNNMTIWAIFKSQFENATKRPYLPTTEFLLITANIYDFSNTSHEFPRKL